MRLLNSLSPPHSHAGLGTGFPTPLSNPLTPLTLVLLLQRRLDAATSQREAVEDRSRSQVQLVELRCSALKQENEGLDGEWALQQEFDGVEAVSREASRRFGGA